MGSSASSITSPINQFLSLYLSSSFSLFFLSASSAPSGANDLIRYVIDARTVPPVAIYSSYRDDDNVLGLNGVISPAPDIPARFAVWYPLTAYSPEYVAMKTAAALGAEAVFIDLPHHALIRAH